MFTKATTLHCTDVVTRANRQYNLARVTHLRRGRVWRRQETDESARQARQGGCFVGRMFCLDVWRARLACSFCTPAARLRIRLLCNVSRCHAHTSCAQTTRSYLDLLLAPPEGVRLGGAKREGVRLGGARSREARVNLRETRSRETRSRETRLREASLDLREARLDLREMRLGDMRLGAMCAMCLAEARNSAKRSLPPRYDAPTNTAGIVSMRPSCARWLACAAAFDALALSSMSVYLVRHPWLRACCSRFLAFTQKGHQAAPYT